MANPRALAKGFDRFKPLGPALLTVDELRENNSLQITTKVQWCCTPAFFDVGS